MDNGLCGAETLEEAKEQQHQLIAISKSACLELHKMYGKHFELSAAYKWNLFFSRLNHRMSWNPQWRHVPSNQNPADLISRGVDPDKFLNRELWCNGPSIWQ
ncbi:hypothetical protein TNCV_3091941 [Trichonephila clavipes]|nr:hypothetical protein TNCV_3091941 [Trichonephila clavipes]